MLDSMTGFLKIEEYDEISVIQKRETDIPDYHISFYGALLHLDKVGFTYLGT